MINEFLPPRYRKPAYVIYALIGVALGTIAVGFGEAGTEAPTWLGVAMAVYTYVGGAVGLTAAVHTYTGKHAAITVDANALSDPERVKAMQEVADTYKVRRRAQAPEVIDEAPEAPER